MTDERQAPAISARGLTKRHGKTVALDGLDLEVPGGSALGLLGLAGSGKSTAIRLLAGLARPSAGAATVAGEPLGFDGGVAARRRLGVVLQEPGLPDWMTGRELLAFMATLAGVANAEVAARIDDVAGRLGLEDVLGRSIADLPSPARGRLAIAQALVGDSEVLLLDEPFQLLDPEGRLAVRAVLRDLRGRTTIVLASHRLADVEGLCDRVALLNGGRLLVEGQTTDFLGRFAPPVYVVDLDGAGGLALEGLLAFLRAEPWVGEAAMIDGALRVAVIDEDRAARDVLQAVVATGLAVTGARRARPSLDAVVAAILGPAKDESAA